jgi:NAD+ kinase
MKRALVASPTPPAQAAQRELRDSYEWVPVEQADLVVALGGDGFMLQTLHAMLGRRGDPVPVFGMNLGTVGFLMNDWRRDGLDARIERTRPFKVTPLQMTARTIAGETFVHPAINEVSLLRETRQTAKLEVTVNDRVVIPELACDGILAATPAGSTAYNLSANGPILPLGSAMIALSPIAAFRPRRWRGAILKADTEIKLEILDPYKRPVSATADSHEVRNVLEVRIRESRERTVTLLFDPEHNLEERILDEQFVT